MVFLNTHQEGQIINIFRKYKIQLINEYGENE